MRGRGRVGERGELLRHDTARHGMARHGTVDGGGLDFETFSLIFSVSLDSIFHDPETGILFASYKYIGYDWAGDSKTPPSWNPSPSTPHPQAG